MLLKNVREFILKTLQKVKMAIKKSIEGKADSANLLLIRDTFTNKSTLGKLYCNEEFIAHTLELPWKDNKKSISCVPKGHYRCSVRYRNESGIYDYVHLLVKDVQNRSYILFHRGNFPSDTKGCILTGTHRAEVPDKIFESKIAHNYLMSYIFENKLNKNINLTIKNNKNEKIS